MYKEYLGDGVYVEYDGYQIVVSANENRIYFDPVDDSYDHVFDSLVEYAKRLAARLGAKG